VRLSYARVTAGLAVTVTLASGATAAISVPANSVGTKQLKRGAVTRAKLQRNSIGFAEVKEASLKPVDLKPGVQKPGPTGPVGPPGPRGETGAPGADVAAVTSIFYRVNTGTIAGDRGSSGGCSPGYSITGVGVALSGAKTGDAWLLDAHATAPNTWEVDMTDQSGGTGSYTITAICVR
jgi:hypothetical protein